MKLFDSNVGQDILEADSLHRPTPPFWIYLKNFLSWRSNASSTEACALAEEGRCGVAKQ
jgi:hypothetical protein